jgi:hypothetical protein
MKKVLLAVAAIALMGFASCSKEKDCHCYYDYTIPIIGTDATQDLGVRHITEGSCKDLESQNSNWNLNFGDLGTGKIRCEKVK